MIDQQTPRTPKTHQRHQSPNTGQPWKQSRGAGAGEVHGDDAILQFFSRSAGSGEPWLGALVQPKRPNTGLYEGDSMP